MICYRCGKLNREGASFCTECGRALAQRAEVNITNQNHRGKYLAAGIIMFAIAAVLIIFFVFFNGTPVEGQWYSKDEFTVLDFKGGKAQIMSLTGTQLSDYEYSRQKGEGSIGVNGETCTFSVEKDELALHTAEDNIMFARAKKDIDADEFIRQGLIGLWSNEKLAFVLELKENGELTIHSIDGEQGSVYDYDTESGEGSLIIGGKKTNFIADNNALSVTGAGVFTKQKTGFDIAAFIEEFGNPLKGVWYDASGVMGEFNFQDEGILSVTSYGTDYRGTYTYSNSEGKGTLSFGNKTMDVEYSAGVLKIEGKAFTRNVVAQKDKSSVFEQITGKWYDKKGNGTIQISKYGSVTIERDGNTANAECLFDPLSGSGTVTIRYDTGVKTVNLLISDGLLAVGEWIYTRDVVEQADNGITGTWYDSSGRFGTLTLKPDGTAELVYSGSTFSGNYTFDKALGKGTISTVFNGQAWTFDLELQEEFLIVRTGMLFYDTITFTREPVQQP